MEGQSPGTPTLSCWDFDQLELIEIAVAAVDCSVCDMTVVYKVSFHSFPSRLWLLPSFCPPFWVVPGLWMVELIEATYHSQTLSVISTQLLTNYESLP